MSVGTVRRDLASLLQSVPGLRCSADGYVADVVPALPWAMVDYEFNGPISFQHGADEYTWHVLVYADRSAERAAQQLFDRLRDGSDTESLVRVIDDADYSTTSLDYARVTAASQINAVERNGAQYLMVDFTLEVVL